MARGDVRARGLIFPAGVQKPTSRLVSTSIVQLFTMAPKRVLITYGVDVDAVAGWLGSYGGEDSTNDISRGMFWSIDEVIVF